MTRKPSPSRTRAQVSTIDFITGFIIITIALILTVNLIQSIQEPSGFESVKREALAASDSLMSAGYPEDWNRSTVVRAGLLSNNELNTTKLQEIDNLTYDDLRAALNGVTNIYFYFTNATSTLNITGCGHGDPAIPADDSCNPVIDKEKNLVRIDRFVTHNDTIIRLVVTVWD